MALVISPRLTYIGAGVASELPAVLRQVGVAKPLIVTDRLLLEHGVLDWPLAQLKDAGFDPGVFSDVNADPTTADVDALIAALQDGGYNGMIAIGGGSAMDTAKAAGIQIGHDGVPLRQLKAPVENGEGALPLICLPTTAGTGSEMTRVCVITDVETHEKMLIAGRGCVPVAALIDVELSMSMPRRLTADTGLDALCHGLEAYLSVRHSEHADLLAASAVQRVLNNLQTAYAQPDDRDARTEMMLGATHGGIAFSTSSVTLIHGMSRPIGAAFGVPHGMANAMLLNTVLDWTQPHAEARLGSLARAVGVAAAGADDHAAADRLRQGITELVTAMQVPTLSEFGVARDDWFAHIDEMTEQALASGSPANNPGSPSAADISTLYRRVWA